VEREFSVYDFAAMYGVMKRGVKRLVHPRSSTSNWRDPFFESAAELNASTVCEFVIRTVIFVINGKNLIMDLVV
jgi:hypothetical protein